MKTDIKETKKVIQNHVDSGLMFPNLVEHNKYSLTITFDDCKLILKALEQQARINELKSNDKVIALCVHQRTVDMYQKKINKLNTIICNLTKYCERKYGLHPDCDNTVNSEYLPKPPEVKK